MALALPHSCWFPIANSNVSWLVGGWATLLKNMKASWDDYSQYMENMFQTTKQMGNVNKKKRFLALPPPVQSIVHSCHQCIPKKQNGPNSPSEMAAVWSLRFEVAGISRFLAEVQQEFPESNVEIIGIPGNHPVAPFLVPTCANCFSRDSEDSPYLGYHDLGGGVDLTIYPLVNIQFAIENGDL